LFLERLREQLTDEQFADLLNQSEKLAQVQATEDSPEVLATIPSLSLEDIDTVGDEYPINTYTEASVLVAEHPVMSSFGILYIDFGMDMSIINLDDLELFPLLARLMLESGTSELDDVQLARRIGAQTGGIDLETMVESILPSVVGDDAFVVQNGNLLETKLFFRGKCTKEQVPELFSLYREILFDGGEISEVKTLTILREMVADLEDAIGEDGDLFAARRIAARYTVHGYIREQLGGISHLQKLKEALETAEADWGGLWSKLDRMKRDLIEGHRNGMILNLTGEKQLLGHIQEDALDFVKNGIPLNQDATPFPNFAQEEHPWVAKAKEDMLLSAPLVDEGIIVPTSVSYVGMGGVLYSPGEPIHGSAAVVTSYLELGYLYDNLRLARGAYGASAQLRMYSGILDLLTYRDPNLVETLRIYDGASAALMEDILSAETLPPEATDTIIGTIGALDGSAPQPDQLGWNSLRQYLRRETSEMRQAWRDQILGTTRDDFLSFATRLSEMADASIAVVSSQAAIEDAQSQGVDLELVSLT
jgi:Zn-dependent M16 (insulinase) family peptidase